MIQGRFRFWRYGDVVVEIPIDAPRGTLPPPTLAEVPPDWTRRPQTPPNPPRPGGR